MLATAGPLPEGPGWSYEVKWDGVRALAAVGPGPAGGDVALRLVGRSGKDVTSAYPELQEVADALRDHAPLVLDGEVVALDSRGRPDFGALQHRMHVADRTRAARLAAATPVTYVAFDLLTSRGSSLAEQPYRDRREALLTVLDEAASAQESGRLLLSPAWSSAEVRGDDVLAAVRSQGLEGLVAKRTDAPYAAGRRSPAWVKVRVVKEVDVVVVGWEPGEGSREGSLGALLVADRADDGTLAYAGQVGTGFSEATLRLLADRLAALGAPEPAVHDVPATAARAARWVRPELVARVGYGSRTRDGRLRHPSFRGLQAGSDVDPGPAPRAGGRRG